jgi:hybrid cluster-associated redox disulfide protein
MPSGKITKKTKLSEAIGKHPEITEIFLKNGLHCLGCSAAAFESIEDGCTAHGMDKKQIDSLIKEINKKISRRGGKNA